MGKHKKYVVVLTSDAVKILLNEPISILIKNRKHFNCIEIDPNNPFFYMKIEEANDGHQKFLTDLYIPHHFIQYYLSSDSENRFGF